MKDINTYISNMALAMKDKLWFLDKMNDKLKCADVYDLGCADGELIRHIAHLYPESTFTGLDISDDMLALAREKQSFKNERYLKIAMDEMMNKIDVDHDKNVILILSSVLHEIFTYEDQPHEYINYVVDLIKPDFILIRDMLPMRTIDRTPGPEYNLVRLFAKDDMRRMLNEFENIHGSIKKSQRNLVHFLLKYRYKTNWDREVKENYLPLCFEDIVSDIFPTYISAYQKSYILPFIKETIYKDWNIVLNDNTHANFILEHNIGWKDRLK